MSKYYGIRQCLCFVLERYVVRICSIGSLSYAAHTHYSGWYGACIYSSIHFKQSQSQHSCVVLQYFCCRVPSRITSQLVSPYYPSTSPPPPPLSPSLSPHHTLSYVLSRALSVSLSISRGGGLGSSTIFKNLMSPTPRRKWYLTTGRRAH